MNIVVDLIKDWVDIMHRQLLAEGVGVGSLTTDAGVSDAFWNMIQRRCGDKR